MVNKLTVSNGFFFIPYIVTLRAIYFSVIKNAMLFCRRGCVDECVAFLTHLSAQFHVDDKYLLSFLRTQQKCEVHYSLFYQAAIVLKTLSVLRGLFSISRTFIQVLKTILNWSLCNETWLCEQTILERLCFSYLTS